MDPVETVDISYILRSLERKCLCLPIHGNFISKSIKRLKILQMELTPLEKNDIVLLLLLFLLLHWPSNRALCFPPFSLPALLPSFSICPLSTGQKREVEVIYGYNPLCTAKKINLNEVIYYLRQVFCTQNCLSELVRIDFPYFPCQPLACRCSLEVNKPFKVAGFSPSLGTWLRGLACVFSRAQSFLLSPALNHVYEKNKFQWYLVLRKLEVKHILYSHFGKASRIFLLESNNRLSRTGQDNIQLLEQFLSKTGLC